MQFGVNHLGHWIFTAGLLSSIVAADAARIATVTSTAHHIGRAVDPDTVNMDGNDPPWGAAGRAKLPNLHVAIGLQSEFERTGGRAQSPVANPGRSHTDLQTHTVEAGGGGWLARASEWLAVTRPG